MIFLLFLNLKEFSFVSPRVNPLLIVIYLINQFAMTYKKESYNKLLKNVFNLHNYSIKIKLHIVKSIKVLISYHVRQDLLY